MLSIKNFHQVKLEILDKYDKKYHNIIIDALYFIFNRQHLFHSNFSYEEYIRELVSKVKNV